MNFKKQISPAVAIADQPTEDDLRALKKEGFVGVVNLRHDGEPDQPLSTVAEGEKVRALGMNYLHVGVGGAAIVNRIGEFGWQVPRIKREERQGACSLSQRRTHRGLAPHSTRLKAPLEGRGSLRSRQGARLGSRWAGS